MEASTTAIREGETMNTKRYAEDYALTELMCIAAAKEIRDGEKVLLGWGLPLLAGTLAKLSYAPNIQLMIEVGVFDWKPPAEIKRAPIAFEGPIFVGAAMLGDMLDSLGVMLMSGDIDVAFLGAAQVDRCGNLNTICIGDYRNPTKRLPGSGGNTDAACLAKRTIIILPQEQRRFVREVDFLSGPGYIDGPGGRQRHGLAPQGPNAIISTMGVYRFDTPDGGASGSCEMYLDAVFPNVPADLVQEMCGWDLKCSPDIHEVEPPTVEEVALLQSLDPYKRFLVGGRY